MYGYMVQIYSSYPLIQTLLSLLTKKKHSSHWRSLHCIKIFSSSWAETQAFIEVKLKRIMMDIIKHYHIK